MDSQDLLVTWFLQVHLLNQISKICITKRPKTIKIGKVVSGPRDI